MGKSPGAVYGNTLARQIHAALTERILSGDLPEHTRLKDNEVAALFGTSNTPVREALRELAKDGLVELEPYRGCVVRGVNLDELAEIYDVRIALEGLAAKLATPRLTEEQLQRLEQLVNEYEAAVSADDLARVSEIGTAFHRVIVEAAGSGTLARVLRDLNNRIQITRRYDAIRLRLPERPSHRVLLGAFQSRDAERAAALLVEHITNGKVRVLEGLRARAAQNKPQS